MPKTSAFPLITSTDVYKTESNPSTSLGAKVMTQDGRFFRYAKAGASDLVIGNLIQAPAEVTNFKDMAVQAAAAIGATTIAVTLGGTSTTAGQFNQGFLVVSVTPGIGFISRIQTHDVATNGTTCNFTVEDPIPAALTTSSKVSVVKNPYDSVIQMPTTHSGAAAGAAVSVIKASTYGWLQVEGVGAALSDATVTAAATMGLSASVTTAGCVTKLVTADAQVAESLYTVSVSAEVQPVNWLIG